MEKVETARDPATTTSPTPTEQSNGRRPERPRIEARALRWWAAYGGGAVSNR